MLICSECELHSSYFTRELIQESKVSTVGTVFIVVSSYIPSPPLNPASVHAVMVVSDNSDIAGFYFLVFLI